MRSSPHRPRCLYNSPTPKSPDNADPTSTAAIARTINNRPRGILDWRTPAEAFEEQLRSTQHHTVATTG